MKQDKPQITPDKNEGREDKIRLILNLIMEKYAEYVTEGNNGVIFKFDTKDLSDEDRLTLSETGVISHSTFAIKLLKLYRPGKGEHEHQMQKLGQTLIETQGDKSKSYARVPKSYRATDILLPDKFKQHLKSVTGESRGEVIIMDFVEGKDLAQMMYQHVITHSDHPTAQQFAHGVDAMSFDRLHSLVTEILAYAIAKPKGDPTQDYANSRKVANDNAQKLTNFLQKNNFKIDVSILEKVRNVLLLWRKNDFFHNDLHPRNIMIDGNGEAYIIDFGSAQQDRESKSTHVDDDSILILLEALTKSFEESRKQGNEMIVASITQLIKQLASDEPFTKLVQLCMLEKVTFSQLSRKTNLLNMITESNVKKFIALLKILVDKQMYSNEEVLTGLIELQKNTASVQLRNIIQKYLQVFRN